MPECRLSLTESADGKVKRRYLSTTVFEPKLLAKAMQLADLIFFKVISDSLDPHSDVPFPTSGGIPEKYEPCGSPLGSGSKVP